jgi:hypothetical protein
MTQNFSPLRIEFGPADLNNTNVIGTASKRQFPQFASVKGSLFAGCRIFGARFAEPPNRRMIFKSHNAVHLVRKSIYLPVTFFR